VNGALHEGAGAEGHGNAVKGKKGSLQDGVDEDDGVVLMVVVGKRGERSILVALDGKTLTELARAVMP
jgi:hypothetical protein